MEGLRDIDTPNDSTTARQWRTAPEFAATALAVADFAIVTISALLTMLVMKGAHSWGGAPLAGSMLQTLKLGAATAVFAVMLMALFGSYRGILQQSLRDRFLRGGAPLATVFCHLALLLYLFGAQTQPPAVWIALWFVAGLMGLGVVRTLLHTAVKALEAEGALRRRVVVLAAGAHGNAVLHGLSRKAAQIEIARVFQIGLGDDPATLSDEALVLKQLVTVSQVDDIGEVCLAIPFEEHSQISRIQATLAVLPARIVVCGTLPKLKSDDWQPTRLAGASACVTQHRPLDGRQRLLKSTFDRTVSGVALVLLSPLFLMIAAAIKIETRGPVFFRQRRNGYNQQEFRIYKFRSMSVLEDGNDVRQAAEGDARVTRVGRILRRSSLDELPQLINVFRGEMSLVGPRPHALTHNQQYGALIADYDARHRVRPGISGWAQVHGLRGETRDVEQMRQRVEYDLDYIENASFSMDLRILLRTVRTVFEGTNAH